MDYRFTVISRFFLILLKDLDRILFGFVFVGVSRYGITSKSMWIVFKKKKVCKKVFQKKKKKRERRYCLFVYKRRSPRSSSKDLYNILLGSQIVRITIVVALIV